MGAEGSLGRRQEEGLKLGKQVEPSMVPFKINNTKQLYCIYTLKVENSFVVNSRLVMFQVPVWFLLHLREEKNSIFR